MRKSFCGRLILARLLEFLLDYGGSLVCIYIRTKETSSVQKKKKKKMQFTGTFPNLRNLLIKPVASLMWKGSFSAKGLWNSPT